MKKKKLLLLLAIPVVLFLLYLGYTIWYRENIRSRFTPKMEKTESESGAYQYVGEDGYLYYLKLPDVLIGGYNMGITSGINYEMDENGNFLGYTNEYCGISIYFRYFTTHWDVNVLQAYFDDNQELQTVTFELDENMQLRNEEEMSAVQKQLYEDMKPRIRELYDKVYNMWGICKVEDETTN